MRPRVSVLLLVLVALAPRASRADVQDWQVSEVVIAAGSSSGARYIELVNMAGGCLFPSSRVEVFDAAGALVGAVAPVASTTCMAPGTYFLLATSAAVMHFGTGADHQIVPPIPGASGQVCFTSSASRYDCVRWGAITQPVLDFFGATDTSSAMAPPDGVALTRVGASHVIAVDWALASPTPRGPNDGTPWFPPDAGPPPDAASSPDGDAGPMPPDARPVADARVEFDARNQRFLDLDPGGGASCSCRTSRRASPARGAAPAGWGVGILGALALLALRRREA